MLFICILITITIADKLLLSQILWRHGARTPLHCNWNCEEFKKQGLMNGYLTPTGMRQHYVLGQWLRQRYVDDMKFLSDIYNESEIYIDSTDVNRTIMSAQSNLQGMYPIGKGPEINQNLNHSYLLPPNTQNYDDLGAGAIPGKIQVIPVHVREKKYDIYLRGYDPQACPRNEEIISDNLNSKEFYEINNQSKNLISDFAEQVGVDAKTLSITDLYEYQDTFDSCEFNGYPKPNLKPQTALKLKQLQYLYFVLEHNKNFEQAQLLATPFLQKVINNIDNTLNHTNKHKYRVFSAHDTTVELILNALNITTFDCLKKVYFDQNVENKNCIYTFPGYASNIIFELYQNEGENQDYYIQILYNGTVMPICNNQLKCSYTQFKEIIEFQNVKNYEEECYLIQEPETQMSQWLVAGLSCGITLIVIFSLCVVYLLIRQKRFSQYAKGAQQFEA